MVLDSSVIVAIELLELGHEGLLDKIRQAELLLIGAPSVVEAAMVLSSRLKRDALPQVMELLRTLRVEIVPFGEEHARIGISAFRRFGRGQGRAKLNFGDCLTYATASLANLPLLFTGDDFTYTDIESA